MICVIWWIFAMLALSHAYNMAVLPIAHRFSKRLLCSTTNLPPIDLTNVPSGLLAIYKPPNMTSARAVARIKHILERGKLSLTGTKVNIKVGHGGSLDPLAEGVLTLGIGKGTKLMEGFLKGSKRYTATGRLGTETDTLDTEGSIVEEKDCCNISLDNIESALEQYRGDIMQIPPMYSALSRGGEKLYNLARAGITIERDPRPVTVYSLELLRENAKLPYFCLDVECSGGFYVRVLISDLAKSCGGVAHMTNLIRTKHGPYLLEHCLFENDWTYEKIIRHIKYCSEVVLN